MVRTVTADENVLTAHTDNLFRKKVALEVGIVVGRSAAAAKSIMTSLVPTPGKDADGPPPASLSNVSQSQGSASAAKKGGKGKSSSAAAVSTLILDEEWIAEHARQVSRMLVGGIHVLGLYVFCPDSAFKGSLAIFWQAVKLLADAVPSLSESAAGKEFLLFHISSEQRRYAARTCSPGRPFASAVEACEVKMGTVLPNLHSLTATYELNVELPIAGSHSRVLAGLRKSVDELLAAEEARLRHAGALLDGQLSAESASLGPASTQSDPKNVEFLTPLCCERGSAPSAAADRPSSDQPVWGKLTLTGAIKARAYAYSRETVGRALSDLKADIMASLRARLELMVEAAEALQEEEEEGEGKRNSEGGEGGGGKEEANQSGREPTVEESWLLGTPHPRAEEEVLQQRWHAAMPRRVFVPWHGGLLLCDYVLVSESLEDVQDRCSGLLGVELASTSDIVDQEVFADAPSSFRKAGVVGSGLDLKKAAPQSEGQGGEKSRGQGENKSSSWDTWNQCFAFGFGCVGVALLAVAVGLNVGTK